MIWKLVFVMAINGQPKIEFEIRDFHAIESCEQAADILLEEHMGRLDSEIKGGYIDATCQEQEESLNNV